MKQLVKEPSASTRKRGRMNEVDCRRCAASRCEYELSAGYYCLKDEGGRQQCIHECLACVFALSKEIALVIDMPKGKH